MGKSTKLTWACVGKSTTVGKSTKIVGQSTTNVGESTTSREIIETCREIIEDPNPNPNYDPTWGFAYTLTQDFQKFIKKIIVRFLKGKFARHVILFD